LHSIYRTRLGKLKGEVNGKNLEEAVGVGFVSGLWIFDGLWIEK